jgi:hypothetical protein
VRQWCDTRLVPTTRRRHAITETEPVQAALDQLRRELGTDRVDLGELVVLGADTKLAALRAQRDGAAVLGRRLADRVRAREPLVDRDAADLVRQSGGARSAEPWCLHTRP